MRFKSIQCLDVPVRTDGRIIGLTLWLLVAVVEDYIRSVVDACGEILRCAFAKLVHPEDNVIDVGDAVYVVLKYVYAERVEQIWTGSGRNRLKREQTQVSTTSSVREQLNCF